MRKNAFAKNIIRTITGSPGRFIAILAIIALGVGFFTGLKMTKPAMIETCDSYVDEHDMYDYRIVSTIGITDEDADALSEAKGIKAGEGAVTDDFFSEDAQGNRVTLRAHSITEDINTLSLKEGRMPKNDRECVGDAMHFSSEDIGREVEIAGYNDEDTRKAFKYDKYTMVGLVDSVYYLERTDRGVSDLGDGSLDAYIYLERGAFTSEYYTDLFLTAEAGGPVFSARYDRNIEKYRDSIENSARKTEENRYADIIADAQEELDDGYAEYEQNRKKYEDEKADTYAQLAASKENLDSGSGRLKAGREEINSGREELTRKKKNLNASRREAAAGKAELEKNIENMEKAGLPEEQTAPLKAQLAELDKNLAAIDNGLARISTGEKELASREKELTASENTLQNGYREYERGRSRAAESFNSAAAELDEARRDLDKAQAKLDDRAEDKPEVYLYTREDNTGYASFDDNSDIVDSIAKVFPLFFLLIAVLVCSTTMSRMIEEERGQIGCLLAIGYTKGRIMMKYMIYSGSAALAGCLLGFFLGTKFFPWAIWKAYGILFGFAPLEYIFSLKYLLISISVALVCSAGTTYFALRAQMKEPPAQILRPKAPKAGKRILLERIRPLWKRMKFLHKVTARNIFRYKKRMFMMLVGIAGCTALVLAGLGIYDSIAGIAEYQYDEIETYDMTAYYDDDEDISDMEMDEYTEVLAPVQRSTVTSGQLTLNLMVSDSPGDLQKVINFRDPDGGGRIDYPGDSQALINDKTADMLNIAVGDKITVIYDDTSKAVLTVSGIYRNYVGNYIFITGDTYEKVFGKDYDPDTSLIKLRDGADPQKAREAVNSENGVIGLSLTGDIRQHVADMMDSLNFIVWLVIASAALLAFIVLFNLSNINITEREREIATIKVLGFYPGETGAYVFRENIILVMMGILLGCPLGYLLHKFIMYSIVVDMVSFNQVIRGVSYVYGGLMVMAFAVFTDLIMRRKLRKINMAEALKSVE